MVKNLFDFLLADADETQDHGAEHRVEQQLKEEVRAHKTNDHELADVGAKTRRICPSADRLHEEQQAADQKHTRVDDRAGNGGKRHGERAVLVLDRLVDKAGGKTGQRALGKHRQDRAEHVDAEECSRVAAEQNDHAEYKAEPRTRARAVESGADHDRHEHQRDAERTELDEAAQQLQHNDDGREQAKTDDLLRVGVFLVHKVLLS